MPRAHRTIVSLVAVTLCIVGGTWTPSPARASHSCDHPPDAPEPLQPPRVEPARIRPARDRVRLAHGASVRRVYTLTRPASPTPVDVFFLVDTTSSMSSAICGVQVGLVDIALGLHAAGIDARFGVGDFRDYPFEPWGQRTDFAYRRRRAVGALDEGLIRAVGRLRAEGGGDGLESGLAALYQTATGAGQDVAPTGPSHGDIKPGLSADFRIDALKVVIMVTDVAFRKPGSTRGYPGPTWDRVLDVLRDHDVLQIGIDAGNASDLRPMARATGALAPPGGVDCDDDGTKDLRRSEPLVCRLEPPPTISFGDPTRELELAPAIVAMVKAVRDVARIRHVATGDARIVGGVRPHRSLPVDLKADNVVRFSVRYACGDLAGVERVRLAARVRGEVIARAATTVTCDPPPMGPVITAPAAAAAAPTTPHAPQPQAQSQAQGQANAAMQPNVAAVPQQQGQLQVALQQANDGELAMTARRRGPHPATLPAGGAAMALCAAILAARTRTRTRTAIGRKVHR